MIAPEILAEQVMGYVVGADELIPTLKPSSKPYNIAILPQGPHFYTGLLQAAGYLLLDSQKRKMIIISQQTDSAKDIIVDSNMYGPVLGQSWKNSITDITTLAHQLDAKISTPEEQLPIDHIHFQLPFLRVITDTDELLHISVGNEISAQHKKKTITWIKNHLHEYNIILLTNIELTTSSGTKKSDEQKQIAKIIEKPSSKTPLVEMFQKILVLQKKKPEIIAYVNPGDFGIKGSLMTRYVCAVG